MYEKKISMVVYIQIHHDWDYNNNNNNNNGNRKERYRYSWWCAMWYLYWTWMLSSILIGEGRRKEKMKELKPLYFVHEIPQEAFNWKYMNNWAQEHLHIWNRIMALRWENLPLWFSYECIRIAHEWNHMFFEIILNTENHHTISFMFIISVRSFKITTKTWKLYGRKKRRDWFGLGWLNEVNRIEKFVRKWFKVHGTWGTT